MRVLQIVPSYYPAIRYGGPIVSVRRLCVALRDAGADVDVVTTNCDGPSDLDVPTDRWVDLDGLRVRYFRRWPRIGYAPSAALTRFLVTHAADYELFHLTSTFSYPSLVGGWAAGRARRPYVVSPRGSLQGWSLSQKRWKKAPYWWLLERRHLAGAAAIHVTADLEEEAVRTLLPGGRTFTAPNGVDIPEIPAVPRVPGRIAFLGRIHRKKGFDVLVPALSRLASEFPDAETLVAGHDDTGEWARVQAALSSVFPRPRIRYVGPLDGDAKWRFLAEASAFVLPSHSENFGQAVVEALACGTPAVVSRNCPWRSLEQRGAGFWVENTPAAVADALAAILRDPEKGARMGEAGRALAASFSWASIGRQVLKIYQSLVDGSRAPMGGGLGAQPRPEARD